MPTEEERLRMLRKAYGVSPSNSPKPKGGTNGASSSSKANDDHKPAAEKKAAAANGTSRPPIKRSTYVPETPLFGLTPEAFQLALFAFFSVDGCVGASRTCKDWHKLLAKPKFLKVSGKYIDPSIELEKLKRETEVELDMALPVLMQAETALASVSVVAIKEIRSFVKPPALVMTVCEAVLVLFGENEPSWDKFKKFSIDVPSFLEKLRTYDKDNISPKIMDKLDVYVSLEQFNPDNARMVSMAGTSLVTWVLGIHRYAQIARIIEPKRKKLRELEKKAEHYKRVMA